MIASVVGLCQDLLTQQVELARVLKIDANEIRGDTGPILTQKDGYRGKDSTLYDELFDFYQVLFSVVVLALPLKLSLLAAQSWAAFSPPCRSPCRRTHPTHARTPVVFSFSFSTTRFHPLCLLPRWPESKLPKRQGAVVLTRLGLLPTGMGR